MLAYVAHYSAPASYFRVVHRNKAEAFGPYQPLSVGDRVFVVRGSYGQRAASKPAVIYVSVDNTIYPVDAARSPLCIGTDGAGCRTVARAAQARGPIVTGLLNLYAMIASKFRVAQEYVTRGRSTTMSMRGSADTPPVIPILSSIAPQQISGRGFAIGWLGGSSPFTVTISHNAKAIRAQRTSLRSARWLDLTLPPGSYRVGIRDAAGRSAQGVFAVDAMGIALQPCPAEATEGSCNDIQAATLVKRGPEWHLAAYQRLALASVLTQPGHALLRWLNEVPP